VPAGDCNVQGAFGRRLAAHVLKSPCASETGVAAVTSRMYRYFSPCRARSRRVVKRSDRRDFDVGDERRFTRVRSRHHERIEAGGLSVDDVYRDTTVPRLDDLQSPRG